MSTHSQSPSPQPLATTDLLCVSMDVPVLDVSCKGNFATCSLWCLASLHDGFKVHPHCSVCLGFFPLRG